MAEVLIKAIDATHPDPVKDRMGYKKGYPVVVMPDGVVWGKQERLPNFVVVKVPGLAVDTVKQYLNTWDINIDYTVIGHDEFTDTYRIELSTQAQYVSVSGGGRLTREMVENYLNQWNATVVNTGTNLVRFDASIYQAIVSPMFWGYKQAIPITFSEESYDSVTGIHRIKVNYSDLLPNESIQWKHKMVEDRIDNVGGSIISHIHDSTQVGTGNYHCVNPDCPNPTQTYDSAGDCPECNEPLVEMTITLRNDVVIFDVSRTNVAQRFKQEVKGLFPRNYIRRQFYISEADIDTVIAAGGTVTLTPTQLMNKLKNKLDD